MSKHVVILGWSGSVHTRRWVEGMHDSGFRVTLISLGGDKLQDIETITLDPKGNREFGYFKYLWKVKKLVNKIKPDLVHSHYATGFGLWGAFSGYHPFLLSVWGSDVLEFSKGLIKKSVTNYILNRADCVTATSRYLADVTVDINTRVRDKIEVIPFGVPGTELCKQARDGETIKIAYIKWHVKKYGPDVLIRAMNIALKENPKISLSIAGYGYITDELNQMVSDFGIEDKVKFVGVVEHEKMPEFLLDHDIMVMPSLMESFGVAVLESSVVGLPVIASRVGGIPEVMDDGKTGLLVPPGDEKALAEAILKLAGDVELRATMGKAGKEFVEKNYLWETGVEKMVTLYNRMIDGA